jgi:hypothetical protein
MRALGYECVQFVASEKATHVVLRRSCCSSNSRAQPQQTASQQPSRRGQRHRAHFQSHGIRGFEGIPAVGAGGCKAQSRHGTRRHGRFGGQVETRRLRCAGHLQGNPVQARGRRRPIHSRRVPAIGGERTRRAVRGRFTVGARKRAAGGINIPGIGVTRLARALGEIRGQ